MKTISITFLDSNSCELRDIDHLGRYIPKEDSSRLGILIPMSFHLDNYRLNARLELWVDNSKMPDKHQKESVIALVPKTCPELFAKYKELNVFQTIRHFPFIGKEVIQEVKEVSYETTVEVNISEILYNGLIEQKAKDKAARDAFNSAKDILYDFACNLTSYGFEYNADDIRELLNYILCCLNSSENLFLTSWNSEKLSSLRYAFEELIRRKVENNRNYKYAQEKAKDICYVLRQPHSWYNEPPNPMRIERIIQRHSRTMARDSKD